jgi:hypothetical protein
MNGYNGNERPFSGYNNNNPPTQYNGADIMQIDHPPGSSAGMMDQIPGSAGTQR